MRLVRLGLAGQRGGCRRPRPPHLLRPERNPATAYPDARGWSRYRSDRVVAQPLSDECARCAEERHHDPHSALSAVSGSVDAARRAGSSVDPNDTMVRTIATATKVAVSVGETLN